MDEFAGLNGVECIPKCNLRKASIRGENSGRVKYAQHKWQAFLFLSQGVVNRDIADQQDRLNKTNKDGMSTVKAINLVIKHNERETQ